MCRLPFPTADRLPQGRAHREGKSNGPPIRRLSSWPPPRASVATAHARQSQFFAPFHRDLHWPVARGPRTELSLRRVCALIPIGTRSRCRLGAFRLWGIGAPVASLFEGEENGDPDRSFRTPRRLLF